MTCHTIACQVDCEGLAPADYQGYAIELWEAVAASQGWSKGDDWLFTCLSSEEAMHHDMTHDPHGRCTVNGRGLELIAENLMTGEFKFSWPFYKSGFSVIVTSKQHEPNQWLFTEVYHWSIWMAIVLNTFLMAIIVTIAEVLMYGSKANRKGLRGWFWYFVAKAFHFVPNVGDPQTWASRILVLGVGWTALIMVHLFTATIASKMLKERMANTINSKADLMGRTVGTWPDEVGLVRKYGMKAVGFGEGMEETSSSVQEMLDKLRDHQVDALVLDTPAAEYYTSTATPACNLFTVGQPFDTFYIGFAFPNDAPDDLVTNVSAAVVRLQLSDLFLDQLENTYMKHAGPCTVNDGTQRFEVNVQVGLAELLGLWWIMAGCAVVGLMIVAGQYLGQCLRQRRKRQQHLQSHEVAQEAQPDGKKTAPDVDHCSSDETEEPDDFVTGKASRGDGSGDDDDEDPAASTQQQGTVAAGGGRRQPIGGGAQMKHAALGPDDDEQQPRSQQTPGRSLSRRQVSKRVNINLDEPHNSTLNVSRPAGCDRPYQHVVDAAAVVSSGRATLEAAASPLAVVPTAGTSTSSRQAPATPPMLLQSLSGD
eukprot:gene7278-7491_t